MEEQKKQIFYQWIKGDKAGNVEEFDTTEQNGALNFTVFKSGKRISTDLISEFMIEVNDNKIIPIDESLNVKSELKNPTKENILGTENNKSNEKKSNTKKITKQDINPIRILLNKQMDILKDYTTITAKIKLPSKSVYNLLLESFGQDVEKELIETVLETKNFKEIIANAIRENYK